MIIFVINRKENDGIIKFFDIYEYSTISSNFFKIILKKLKIIIFYIELRFFNSKNNVWQA